ncbi:hypothetical protein H6G37_02490 [Synechocystis sp. FACHB-898]|uniref:hypothetical protein n=1 Tax=unclassified Synechocystis TaxID=2640012 RepID=UPI001683A04E|nr:MULTISPECIES: hypothetical protein [unclassified Synechocystis]MBD2617091.1 hypothetical protein [Synechocystis sp. FACHB-898]MBD2638672.1 hypothetical protein [Synechocystis sp. FACHB-908]MBD2659701.1 hypothetical protein [Synechocystis sp. FACHB-929]
MNFYIAQAKPSPSPETETDESFWDRIKSLLNFAQNKPADKINQQLQDRYHGIIPPEELQDKITAGEREALAQQLSEGGEMNLDAIRTEGSGAELDAKLNQIVAIGGENLDGSGSGTLNFSSPYVFGGGLVGLLVLVWCLQSLNTWSNLREKLMGEEGVYYQILEKFGKAKPKVSESDLFLYNKALVELEKQAKKAISIDNDKFSSNEFLVFAKIRYSFNNDVGDYQGLKTYLQTLQSAIKAQASYLILGQVESSCRGTKQQQFYDFCHQLLHDDLSGQELRLQVKEKLEEVLSVAKTDVGKANLEKYADEIGRLADDPQAIAIMNRFKGEQEDDYATMKKVVDIIGCFNQEEVSDRRIVMHTTMEHYDDFEHLADIIDLPEGKRSPDTYSRLLQYLALEQRHQWSFLQFQNLVEVLRQWHKPFRAIVNIRQKYPGTEFRRPAIFKEPIAGLTLYEKHRNALMDNKTGHSFIAFEDEGDDSEDLTAIPIAPIPS